MNVLKGRVQWLMGLPGGFKPHVHLNLYLGTFANFIIDSWDYLIVLIEPFYRHLIWALSSIGFFGISLGITFMKEALLVVSLHL